MQQQGTKWRILRYLNSRGEATVQEMKDEFGLGLTTLREHLYDLKDRGLIETRKQASQGRGRPTHYYELTERARKTFPDSSDSLGQMLYRLFQRSLNRETLEQTLEELLIEYLQETNREIRNLLDEYGHGKRNEQTEPVSDPD